MKVYKKVEIELTYEEKQILLKARDLIDTFINEMEEYNLKRICTGYNTYDETKLDEIATDLHSLSTICDGE